MIAWFCTLSMSCSTALFFFSSRRRHTRCLSDWSSDVCSSDLGVDVVLLAEPPGFRPMHFEAAVKAGKHVFMEKPVATDPSGIRRILAAATEADRKSVV